MTTTAPGTAPAPGHAVPDSLVIGASLADPERFGEIYDRHAAVIHRYLARRIGVPVADDLASETFLAAFRIRGRYDPDRDDALPWLYGIATNLLRRHQRTERAQYRAMARTGIDPWGVPDHADAVAGRITAVGQAQDVAGALQHLTAKERDVLLLFAWAELGYDEIAGALDIPVGTVRSRLNRARKRLRAALSHPTGQAKDAS
ncbi:RNA polymerase sigma factor [Kitasatospora kazusensis]|uniref:RNA polymerase sigma factor n=1 Tax=Kitasatospora kazusensis TaxID=407974 RepID=A0ABN2ZJ54_9ACTN